MICPSRRYTSSAPASRDGKGSARKALEVIGKAEVLIGHQRHLDIFPDFPGEKRKLEDLSVMLDYLKGTDKLVVVLGSGDPNFFGVARFLLRNLPKERIEIFPNVTSVQYAFARIKEPWDDAIFVSVHGRGLKTAIDRIVAAEKVAILTDGVNTPATIARELIGRGAEGYEAWLCEDLGLPTEKITRTDVKGLAELPSSPLNILILIKAWEPTLEHYPVLGIADEEFATAKKLITKQEVRAVTLAKLQLQDDLVLWDIGAGSGSVSIEAENLMPNGKIFALEKNPQYLSFIRDNLKKFVHPQHRAGRGLRAGRTRRPPRSGPGLYRRLRRHARGDHRGGGPAAEAGRPDRPQRRHTRHPDEGGGVPGGPRLRGGGDLRQHRQDAGADRVQDVRCA